MTFLDKCFVTRVFGHKGIVSSGRLLKLFGASVLTTTLLYNSGMRSTFDEVVIADLARQALGKDVQVQSVDEGISTSVYRIVSSNDAFYFRIAPEDENYTPEVTVHEWLLQREIPVPEIIHYENFNEQLNRSFMIVSQIPGTSLGAVKDSLNTSELQHILFDAGVALAKINSIPLEGFGWIERDGSAINKVKGMYGTYREFVMGELEGKAEALLEKKVITDDQFTRIAILVKRLSPHLNYTQGYLAHGDLDAGHIYVHNGQFSGFIDFGDIRSADPYYDLAHFQIKGVGLISLLLEGYNTVSVLSKDVELRLSISKFILSIQHFGWTVKHRGYNKDKLMKHPFYMAIIEELTKLERVVEFVN